MCLFRSVCITLVMCAVLLLQTLAPERASASDALTAPAVSALNGKLSIQGGLFSDEPTALGLGSLSIPLTHSFGIQLDGALGSLDGDTLRGAGVHLFHRDPARFLLGAYGSYHSWRSVDIWRAALEAEAYIGRFTIEALLGVESVSHRLQLSAPVGGAGGPIFIERVDDKHFFAIADFAYYLQDNFRVSVGYRYVNEESLGTAGLEYLLNSIDSTPISLFAEGQFGERHYRRAMAGVRVYFGSANRKSLIRRHREDDPRNRVPDFFSESNTCPAGRTLEGNQCVLPTPPEEEEPQ